VITIIDYGAGNIGSVLNMCKKIGVKAQISNNPEAIASAESLILPGVGHYDHGMTQLKDSGLIAPMSEAVHNRGVPFLGICLGMQLLLEGSDEGSAPGLGWVKGWVRKFPDMTDENGRALKVPHMGWSDVEPVGDSVMYKDWEGECRFYFVHSFYCDPKSESEVSGIAHYGMPFCCSIEVGNIWASQFHPEKSHRHGMRFLKNALSR
jgi:glutamine amidotransferase